MNLKELVNHTRCFILRDTALPTLWSDTEITRYLNQAEKEFAIRTHEIVDDETPAVVKFTTVAGQAAYDLHASIITVNSVGIVEYDTTDSENPVETNYTPLEDRTRRQMRRRYAKGRPCQYTTQARTQAIRLDPIPDGAYTVEMVVARKPLQPMTQGLHVPELSEEYHMHLCDFAAYRCLTNNRPEGADMASGAEFKTLWDLAVRDAKRAIANMRAGVNPQARSNWTGKRYRHHG
tara:strand:+ start:8869 stop:9573 length:705 start_codon:yes stop_codon:yes gene_type:complete